MNNTNQKIEINTEAEISKSHQAKIELKEAWVDTTDFLESLIDEEDLIEAGIELD